MSELDRRSFLKLALGVGAGVAVTELRRPLVNKAVPLFEKATGLETGNASMQEVYEEMATQCQDKTDPRACLEEMVGSAEQMRTNVIVAPITEELMFRGVPSMLVSELEGSKEAPKEFLFGTPGIGLTRRELLVGTIASLFFGAVHNFTSEGFSTRVVPITQTTGGMIYWYLQRKFGILSNIAAHSWNNFRAISSI